jgi:hypothetical protein
MGATGSGGGDNSPPKEVEKDWEGEPSRCARVRIEKSDLTLEMTCPLLNATINALFVIGAVICPWLTFKAVPADFPTWATLGTIITQLLLLGLMMTVRTSDTSEHGPSNPE